MDGTEAVAAMERWLDDSPEEIEPAADAAPDGSEAEAEELDAEAADEQLEDAADGEESEEAEGETAEGAEAPAIDSLEAIAEHFQVEPDEVLDNVLVDGQNGERVSIREALDGWRRSEHVILEREEQLTEEFRQHREQFDTQANQTVGQLAAMLKAANETLNSIYSKEKVEELRSVDPDAYLAAMESRHKILQIMQGGLDAMKLEADRRQESSGLDMNEVVRQEQRRLFAAKPEWRDEKARMEAQAKHERYLKSLPVPFSDQEINGIMDHRMLLVIDDAVAGAALREGTQSKKVDALKKKGLKRPTGTLRPQVRRDPESPRNRARDQARSRLRKTGDARAAAALIEDLL